MFERWFKIPEKSSLILGIRRAGKTTILKNKLFDYKYVSLDDLDNLEYSKKDPKGFIAKLGNKFVIDEVQRTPILTIAIKNIIDNLLDAKVYMSGSSSIGLLDTSADTLAGRIKIISLPTMCWGEELGKATHSIFNEFSDFYTLKEASRDFTNVLNYGGFPELLSKNNEEQKEELLIDYKNSYFTRDLMQISNIENIDAILAIFLYLAKSLCSHIEPSNMAREAGISFFTAKKYLNILLQSQLLFKLNGYQYGPAKRHIKAAKYYFSDNGIIFSLKSKINYGQIVEQFVISELEKRRKLGFIKTDAFYYYKSNSGREIDLVFEANNQIYACEIKASNKYTKADINNLLEFKKAMRIKTDCYLFYLGEEYKEEYGVKITPVFSFFRGI